MIFTKLLKSCVIKAPYSLHHHARGIKTSVLRFEDVKNKLIKLTPMEIATGMYKRDILESLSGENDPFSVKALSRKVGTKEDPNMIPSAFESRIIGCICEEDSDNIVWMWLHQGESKKCQCGYWFKLYYEAPVQQQTDSCIPL